MTSSTTLSTANPNPLTSVSPVETSIPSPDVSPTRVPSSSLSVTPHGLRADVATPSPLTRGSADFGDMEHKERGRWVSLYEAKSYDNFAMATLILRTFFADIVDSQGRMIHIPTLAPDEHDEDIPELEEA